MVKPVAGLSTPHGRSYDVISDRVFRDRGGGDLSRIPEVIAPSFRCDMTSYIVAVGDSSIATASPAIRHALNPHLSLPCLDYIAREISAGICPTCPISCSGVDALLIFCLTFVLGLPLIRSLQLLHTIAERKIIVEQGAVISRLRHLMLHHRYFYCGLR